MKTLLKIILVLFTLLVVSVAIFFLTFDLNMYKGIITEKISSAIGRKVSIDSMEMKLSLVPTIKIRGIKIANPEGMISEKPFIITDSVEATLAITPLFSRRIEVRDITFGVVGLFLIDNGNDQKNWLFNFSEEPKDISGTQGSQSNVVRTKVEHSDEWLKQMRIDNVTAKNINVVYMQGKKSQSLLFSDFSLKQLKAFSLVTVYKDISMKFSGSLNSILDLLQQKPNYALNLEVETIGTTAKVSANIGNIKEWRDILLNIDFSGNNLKETLRQLKIENDLIPNKAFSFKSILQGDRHKIELMNSKLKLAGNEASLTMAGSIELDPFVADLQGNIALANKNLAAFWGTKPMTIKFDTNVTPKVITLKDVDVQADLSPLQVRGKVLLDTPKPTFDLALKSDTLNIQDIIADSNVQKDVSNTSTKSVENSGVIPNVKIDLSALNLVNANVSFDFPYIRISNSLSGHLGVNGHLTLNNGQLDLNPFSLRFLDSKTTGHLSLNAVQKPYKIALSFNGESLNLGKLRSVSEHVKDVVLDFDVNLTSEGTTSKEILSHLNGNLILEVPGGVIVNKWFNTLPAAIGIVRQNKNMLTFSTTDQESQILCGALNARIKDGKITGDNNLAIETSAINFLVGGDVDLNSETISLTLTPSLNEEQDVVGEMLSAAQYIKIDGTFSAPIATLDTKKAVSNVIHSGVAKLAEKAGLNISDSNKKIGAYHLCMNVLGRQSKGEVLALYKEAEKKKKLIAIEPVEQTEQKPDLSPKEQFKNQLLKSISDALQ